jgi:hypothetical protein
MGSNPIKGIYRLNKAVDLVFYLFKKRVIYLSNDYFVVATTVCLVTMHAIRGAEIFI